MSRRFLAAAVLGLAVFATPAVAQNAPLPGPPGTRSLEPVQPPSDLPKPQRGDRVRGLDFLFEALKIAPDADSAKHIEKIGRAHV